MSKGIEGNNEGSTKRDSRSPSSPLRGATRAVAATSRASGGLPQEDGVRDGYSSSKGLPRTCRHQGMKRGWLGGSWIIVEEPMIRKVILEGSRASWNNRAARGPLVDFWRQEGLRMVAKGWRRMAVVVIGWRTAGPWEYFPMPLAKESSWQNSHTFSVCTMVSKSLMGSD
ncbi:hypothetical protein CRG98_045134 [Punica granatum]|uniref:Uncharacterized protein n=1 Tax=Punica granatum TaxID=22663 RepID=A0A2I0HRY2_PUNGR|nr:hypothetical protein CRG98_045134 [Punica granatum]